MELNTTSAYGVPRFAGVMYVFRPPKMWVVSGGLVMPSSASSPRS
jgi:hypothetical protein